MMKVFIYAVAHILYVMRYAGQLTGLGSVTCQIPPGRTTRAPRTRHARLRATVVCLLPADIERASEQALLARDPPALPATILIAPHHGSKASSTESFIRQVNPAVVVFTVGYRNRFGHPKPQVAARYRAIGAAQFRSDRDGLIRLDFGGAGIQASQYRPKHRRYWQYEFEPDAPLHEFD